MACNSYNLYGTCNRCPHMIRTIDAVVDEGDVVFLIPERVFENFERFCLIICQSIPKTESAGQAFIQVGVTTGTRYPLETTDGGAIYSYQLKSRKKYPVTANVTGSSFAISSKHLCYTSEILTRTTPTPANNVVAASNVKSGGSK